MSRHPQKKKKSNPKEKELAHNPPSPMSASQDITMAGLDAMLMMNHSQQKSGNRNIMKKDRKKESVMQNESQTGSRLLLSRGAFTLRQAVSGTALQVVLKLADPLACLDPTFPILLLALVC